MRKAAIRNVLVLLVMTSIGAVYFARIASTVPQQLMLVVNFVVVPGALGAISYQAFAGQPFARLADLATHQPVRPSDPIVEFTIPNDASLIGINFFQQWVFFLHLMPSERWFFSQGGHGVIGR